MKLLLTGAYGRLGSSLLACPEATSHEVLAPGRSDFDLLSPFQVQEVIRSFAPDAVLHLAAMTDVDACERDPEMAQRVNVEGTASLAQTCLDSGASLVSVSTDFVFSGGDSPFAEGDRREPLQAYGQTKMQAEDRAMEILGDRASVVRLARLYSLDSESGFGWPAFVRDGIAQGGTLRAITDESGHFTAVEDLAPALWRHLPQFLEEGGMFHLVGEQDLTPLEVTQMMAPEAQIEPIEAEALGRPARRPERLSLSSSRLPYLPGFTERLELLKL